MSVEISQLSDSQLASIRDAIRESYSKELGLVARDLGYEVGATLKPQKKADLFTALADLNKLSLDVRCNTTNPTLIGFLDGVISALENPAQKPGR